MGPKIKITTLFFLSFYGFATMSAAETLVPYLEATQITRKAQVQPADLQRQIVLLNAQARLTPDWAPTYRELVGVDLHLGLLEEARRNCQAYLAHQTHNAFAQLQLINIQVEQYQTAEARRQFLDQASRDQTLLPEVISEIHRQLAIIAYQNFENDRARKYLDFAIRSFPLNLKAYQFYRQVLETDKAITPVQEMYYRTGENLAMVTNNPMDALSALRLASLAGRARLTDAMQPWYSYAEGLRKQFAPRQAWPDMLALELAEAYVATDQPKQAMDILRQLMPKGTTTTPATTATQPRPGTALETRVRMLMILAAKQLGDEKIAAEHEQWMDQLAEALKSMAPDIPGRLAIMSIYYSVYAELVGKSNPAMAVTLAQGAMKGDPENRNSRYAMALALAKSGDNTGAMQILKKLDDPTNPLSLVGQALCVMSAKQEKQAQEILARALKTTPHGPLREVLLDLAGKARLANPPEPDFSGVAQLFKKFDPGFLDFPSQYAKACKVTVAAKGEMKKGETVTLTATLTNVSDVALGIGPESFIPPFCLVEIEPVPSDGTKFILDLPIEARQILVPKKPLVLTAVLDRAVAMKGKTTWDEFVARRRADIKQVSLRARIPGIVTLTESVEITVAQTEAVKMDLPVIDEASVKILIGKLNGPAITDPWQTATLARWFLMRPQLAQSESAIAAGMIRQLTTAKDAASQAAFAWALRFAKAGSELFNALAGQLSSKDWFVRLMTLDTLGQLQGKTANPLFQFYAAKDNDDLVRQLSTGYLLYR